MQPWRVTSGQQLKAFARSCPSNFILLTIRMGNRRMTRLTNVFSNKWSNHEAMMNVFFAVYNFCKVHGTIRTTPTVAAGIAVHIWTVRELIEKTSGAY